MSSKVFELEVTPREVTGKRVKTLRKSGFVPGIIYGPLQDEPLSIQVEWQKLRPVLLKAGGTSLIDLQVDDKTVSVLVKTVQRHPVRQNQVEHIDFYAVDVNEVFRVMVPIVVPDIDAVSKRLSARIFQPLNRIETESLPADIPSQIEVDTSLLQEAGDSISVAELPVLDGVTYIADEDAAVIRTVSLAQIAAQMEESLGSDDEDGELLDDGGAEPEVIAKGKEEDEDDE